MGRSHCHCWSPSVDGDTIRVNRGRKRITVRLACIDAPELAQAPYGRTGPQLFCRPVDRSASKVHLLSSQTRGVVWPARGEVIGEVQLEPAMVEDGMALCVPEVTVLGQCEREGLSSSVEFRASPDAAMACGQVPWRNHPGLDCSTQQKNHAICCWIQIRSCWPPLSACSEIGSYARAQELPAPVEDDGCPQPLARISSLLLCLRSFVAPTHVDGPHRI